VTHFLRGTSIVGENYGYLKKYNIFENQIKKPFVAILLPDWIKKTCLVVGRVNDSLFNIL